VPEPDHRGVAIARTFSEPSDVKAWRTGGLLFFHYRSIWTEMYGAQLYRFEFNGTIALRETAAGAQLQLFQATLIPNTLRTPAKVDPAVYDQYVGEYSAGPGDHEVITREGTKLLMTINGDRNELLPIDSSTFYISAAGDDWVFIRGASGAVTGLESRLFGQNVLAKRLR